VKPASDSLDLAFLEPNAPRESARAGLRDVWEVILAELPRPDRAALGSVRVGALDMSEDAVPFAYTNSDEDLVNLTIEIKPHQLELNLVGWTATQSDALKDWLQSVRGEDTVNRLAGFEVIAFARRAYKKTPTSAPWWQSESVTELGTCRAEEFSPFWISKHMIRLPGNRKDVKPAFHIRRAWDRAAALAMGDRLIDELAAEAQRLLPILREIWARA
jgi:hypothetical protein